MEATLRVLNEMEAKGVLRRYAIGGAMALLFHTEPVATFDLDIFCLVPESGPLVSLAPIYNHLRTHGHEVAAEQVGQRGALKPVARQMPRGAGREQLLTRTWRICSQRVPLREGGRCAAKKVSGPSWR